MATSDFSMQGQFDALSQAQGKVVELAVQFGPRLLVAVLVLAAGHYVGRWAGHMLDTVFIRLALDITIRQLLVRIVRMLVLILFLIMALQNLGVDLLPLIAGLGVAGAGIALAMQGVLSNLAAGLTIIFTRPYRVGEYISIAGEEGEVETITLFSTTLSHPDRSLVVIPNRKIAGEILHNYGTIRQVNLTVRVAYDTDLCQALAAVDEVLKANPRVRSEPAPFVQVAALAESSVAIGVRPWVNVSDYGAAISELNTVLLETFRNRGITIPVPRSEVRLLGNS
ncbi:mechanosensitive ion channel family protein [Trichlorobacter ammonificans]|uniref:Mechanosensitive ion channel protein MscS n=1 Tax=Trichlorobacter ammonificans TaxID=2916410 RepID=A0ABN8HMF7_9BACT|nr:mechanosensitive ion channel family protein [Trichlorobacter ammonificans]CAH2032552.1 Mechanosensitive ion channel protein MscS [Trichlorobacter ammonificans]